MMPISDWPNAIAHIDADCFYASCEQLRHPELKGRPVCVLSNQNAFVVAKTYDAKAKGVTTGMSVWDAKKLVPNAAFLTPDFRYYGQLSEKMFSILRRYSPQVEVYSIDEAFMDMNGIRSLWRKSFRQIADDIRQAIRSEVGITVSVGISCTRTLAKISSESNKPNGSTVIPGRRIARFLADIQVSDIPGIGRNRTALLEKFSIHTALEFTRTDERTIDRLMGKPGMGLWHELNGRSVYGLEKEAKLPKSVARTSSMGQVTTDKALIEAYLSYHTQRLVSDLVAKRIIAQRISVFLTLESFEKVGTEVRLVDHTNSLKKIASAVQKALGSIYQGGTKYRASGVIAMHILPEGSATPDLFGHTSTNQKQRDLVLVMNEVNHRFGNHSMTSAQATILGKRKADTIRFQYPLIVAH